MLKISVYCHRKEHRLFLFVRKSVRVSDSGLILTSQGQGDLGLCSMTRQWKKLHLFLWCKKTNLQMKVNNISVDLPQIQLYAILGSLFFFICFIFISK